MKIGWIVFLAIAMATIVSVGGCGGPETPEQPKTLTVMQHGSLPFHKQSHHQGIQDEMARIESEKALPVQLTSGASSGALKGPPLLPDEDNAAVALAIALPSDEAALADKKAEKLFPDGPFRFTRHELEEVVEFLHDHKDHRETIRAALTRSNCDFQTKYTKGLFDKMPFVVAVRVAVRLEAFAVAEMLADDRPDDAVKPLAYMFRLVELLSQNKHAWARRWAAFLREEALSVAAEVVAHDKTSRATLKDLHERIASQLASWPPDADAWIAERAIGLHTYDMIRDGHLSSFITKEELEEFEIDFQSRQRTEQVPSNEEIAARLVKWETKYC